LRARTGIYYRSQTGHRCCFELSASWGTKHAKYVQPTQAVDSLSHVFGGKRGYWENIVDYEWWYAGI